MYVLSLMEHLFLALFHFHCLYRILSVLSFVIYLIFNLIFECMCVVHVCTYVCSHFHARVCGELKNDVKLFLHLLSILFYSGRSLFLNLKLAIQASLASQLAPRTPPSPI